MSTNRRQTSCNENTSYNSYQTTKFSAKLLWYTIFSTKNFILLVRKQVLSALEGATALDQVTGRNMTVARTLLASCPFHSKPHLSGFALRFLIPLGTYFIYLGNKGSQHHRAEDGIAENGLKDIPLTMDFTSINLIEELHHDKSVEDDGVVLSRWGMEWNIPTTVNIKKLLTYHKRVSRENKTFLSNYRHSLEAPSFLMWLHNSTIGRSTQTRDYSKYLALYQSTKNLSFSAGLGFLKIAAFILKQPIWFLVPMFTQGKSLAKWCQFIYRKRNGNSGLSQA